MSGISLVSLELRASKKVVCSIGVLAEMMTTKAIFGDVVKERETETCFSIELEHFVRDYVS